MRGRTRESTCGKRRTLGALLACHGAAGPRVACLAPAPLSPGKLTQKTRRDRRDSGPSRGCQLDSESERGPRAVGDHTGSQMQAKGRLKRRGGVSGGIFRHKTHLNSKCAARFLRPGPAKRCRGGKGLGVRDGGWRPSGGWLCRQDRSGPG